MVIDYLMNQFHENGRLLTCSSFSSQNAFGLVQFSGQEILAFSEASLERVRAKKRQEMKKQLRPRRGRVRGRGSL